MRVLWICSTPSLGAARLGVPAALVGGWTAALERAVQRRRELDLSIAFPWNRSDVGPFEIEGHRYLPFPGYPRGSRLRRLLVDFSCRLEPETEIRHLELAVETSRPDLIHVWGTEGFFGLIASRVDLPVLIEIQGLRTLYFEAYCAGLTRWDLLRHGSPKRLLNGRSLLHGYYRYRAGAERERRILAQAEFLSGRTDWDRTATADLAPQARYFHVDRVLRPPFYDARWRRRPDGPLRLISTLRGNAYKGIEVIAGCAERLRGRLDDGLLWTLVGVRPGEEVHRVVEGKLGVSFERLGIRLVGRQPAEEVARRLLDADLFVLPAHVENSPNGLCEAMVAGMPIVSTDVGGVPTLLEDGREGLLVPPGDPIAMAEGVKRMAEQSDLADRMAAAARQRALERHDPGTVADALLGVYREILEARS